MVLHAQEWSPNPANTTQDISRPGNVFVGDPAATYSSSTLTTKLGVDAGTVTYGPVFGVEGTLDANGTSAEGNAVGRLARGFTWSAHGALFGTEGIVNVDKIRTGFANKIAYANGGRFVATLNDPIPSANANSFDYELAGVNAELRGTMTVFPGTGFVAAVSGRDKINASGTWAGYFEGKGHFSGQVGIGTKAPLAQLDVRSGNIFQSPNAASGFPNQFAAMGSSPGACPIYGFRAQEGIERSINMGIEANQNPTISWANPDGTGDLDFDCDNNPGGCGTLKAKLSCSGSVTLTVNGAGSFSGGVFTPSDQNLKSEVRPLENAMDIIRALEGVRYRYNSEVYPEYNFSPNEQVGFIAQKVKAVIPEAVIQNEDGMHLVNYDMVIPYLVEGMQEMDLRKQEDDARINALEAEVEELKAMVREMCGQTGQTPGSAAQPGKASLDGQLKAPTLYQNVPNPFENNTRIAYFLPQGTENAELQVRDLRGNLVLSYALQAGNGSVDVPGSTLAAGTYLYSMVVNGESLATRRMILTR